jgi:hypothetical protein
MENEKNNNGYNNKNYLNKREDPTDNAASLNQENKIEEKVEEKFVDPPKKSDGVKPIENIDDGELADSQKEMHPEINIRKNKNYTIPLIFGVIILIIIGQQIIKSSMQSMQELKTYNYNGIMEFDIENKENSEGFNFDIELSGKADQANINNIKSSINLKTTVDVSMEGSTQELSFDLDTMQFGQKMTYIKLNDFDLGAIGMMMGPEVSSLKEKWYKLDLEELEKLNSASPDSVSGIGMRTYDMNKIMELYSKYELLKFQEDLGDIKLGNTDTYHYKVKLDGIALVNFYVDILKEMTEEQELNKTLEQIEDDIKKYDHIINDVTDNINMEVWIGKEDRFIYRIKMNGEFDREFMEILENKMIIEDSIPDNNLAQKTTDDFEISFNVNINTNNFNGPVVINEPKETENLMEILGEMFGGFLGTGVTETEIDTDKDGLPDYIENIYGTDLNNPDTDGDGYKDGEEVENGYNPLVPGNAKIDYDKLLK